MDKVFLTILNMSLTGSFVIVVICLARLLLKKAPKIISYFLWVAAGFRLVFPFSIESMFSLIPFQTQTISLDVVTQHIPQIDSGVASNIISGALPAAALSNSVSPLQILTAIGSNLWFLGVAVMLVYGVSSYLLVKRRMRECDCVGANLYESENIRSPFVLGIIAPKIYIPTGLSLKEREYILLHEQTHIRRHDQIIKLMAYFVLCLHWFNPLVWVAFLLMGMDMEMSCDEYVLKDLGGEIKRDYSISLLSLATERRVVSGSPLAFGEDGVKRRIKNVLSYRKSSRVVVALAIVFVAVLSLGLVGSRTSSASSASNASSASSGDLYDTQTQEPEMSKSGSNSAYVSDYTDSDSVMIAENIYIITDYYNEDGKFSDLGLMLEENNSERVLAVSGGDILIAGDRQYEITTQSLTLSFYTQPSRDQVILWWNDYLSSWAQSDKVALLS